MTLEIIVYIACAEVSPAGTIDGRVSWQLVHCGISKLLIVFTIDPANRGFNLHCTLNASPLPFRTNVKFSNRLGLFKFEKLLPKHYRDPCFRCVLLIEQKSCLTANLVY